MLPSLLRAVAWCLLLTLAGCFGSCDEPSGGERLRLATTTSVADSGLLAALLPAFEEQAGYGVEIQAVGSGKALELLAAGQADVAITHAPEAEQQAVVQGRAGRRTVFMQNDFVVVGPKDGGAVVAGARDAGEVLRRIVEAKRRWISRADGSGTHLREQALWRAAGLSAEATELHETRAGMGRTLEIASDEDGYTLSDRATFVSLRKDLDLAIVFQDDPALDNRYAVLELAKPAEGTRSLAEFLRSEAGRAIIGSFGIADHGEPLFTPE
jgi:tungstate transport system substrate-binding protein